MRTFKSIIKYVTVVLITVIITVNVMSFINISEMDYISAVIKNKYVDEVDEEKLIDGAKVGMVDALGDKRSFFITSEYGYENFEANSTGEYVGIGVTITIEEKSDYIKVVKASKGAPAYEAGIREGDYIVKADDTDLKGKTTTEASNLIKGKENTKVKVTVLRNDEEKEFTVTRKKISVQTVTSEMLKNNIGYVKIEQFDIDTDDELFKQMDNLKNVDGLVVDLRNNPGGIMQVAISILDKFLEKDAIVLTARYKDSEQVYKSENDKEYDMPLVVLVDQNSASASEIFAAAIKENNRGKIVGTKTYGKGSIQQTFPLLNNQGIHLTVGRFYSPDGNIIDEVGVLPDVLSQFDEDEKILSVSELPKEQDVQLQEALKQFK